MVQETERMDPVTWSNKFMHATQKLNSNIPCSRSTGLKTRFFTEIN